MGCCLDIDNDEIVEIRGVRLDRIKELKLQHSHFIVDKTFSIEHYL